MATADAHMPPANPPTPLGECVTYAQAKDMIVEKFDAQQQQQQQLNLRVDAGFKDIDVRLDVRFKDIDAIIFAIGPRGAGKTTAVVHALLRIDGALLADMVSYLKAAARLYKKQHKDKAHWKPTIILELETSAEPATADMYLDKLKVLTTPDERALRDDVYANATTRAIDLIKLSSQLKSTEGPATDVVRAFIRKAQKQARTRVRNLIKAMLEGGGSLPVEDASVYIELPRRRNGPTTGMDPIEWPVLPRRRDVIARELCAACEAGDAGRVRALIEAGADVHFADADGFNALMMASNNGHAECARLLLEAGADVNHERAPDSDTALTMASEKGHAECVRLLLEAGADAGADVLAILNGGGTSLSYASILLMVQMLCAYGARRDALYSCAGADCRAWVLETSAWTSELHHIELLPPARVRQLIVGGADVHASDGSGNGAPTPLGLARALLARDPAHEGASLLEAAAAPWSCENHALFPAHARARAAELLRLGQLLVREARFAGKEGALLDVWPLVVAHALGRSMPARLVLHAAIVGRSATITSQPAGGEFLIGREGVVTAVSGEWESVELELDDGERVSVPVASININLAATSAQPVANRRLTATLGGLEDDPVLADDDPELEDPELNGRKVRLLGWVGSRGRWRVQLDRSAIAPLDVRHANLLALGNLLKLG
ncbi:hypothetical protein T492DRAFT_869919 [Pavlovales sp. CCMP2436]|nr:hypothetical protein T492DRAFT_869919 [Pavlovales sp. CCMP2436]